jgi:predicted nucleic acid-binding Zn ribbon protein
VRRASQKPQKLGDILQHALKRHKIPVHFEDQVLRHLWDQSVGPQISAQTSPEHVKKGTLYVKVASSVWMHQLQFLKEEMMNKFNLVSGREPIRSIHFSIGELPPGRTIERRSSPGPLSFGPLRPRDKRIIKESLVAIADEELREILERVMTKEIGRRRFMEKKRIR